MLVCSSLTSSEENNFHELATFGGEPSTIIDGCVSAITGNFFLSQEDLVVSGREPIRIKREYFSGDGEDYDSGWRYFYHSLIAKKQNPIPGCTLLHIPEKYGFTLLYASKQTKNRKKYIVIQNYPDSLTNCYTGEISGRLNTKNNVVYEDPGDKNQVIVEGADGSKRIYRQVEKGPSSSLHLIREHLPNENQIHYDWSSIEGIIRLIKITTTSPQGKHYASVNIEYHGNGSFLYAITFKGSDGQSLTYEINSNLKQHHTKHAVLSKTLSPTLPTETLEHWGADTRGYYLSKILLPEGRFREIQYYSLNDTRSFDLMHPEKDARYKRVKTLHAPRGWDGETIPYYSFTYSPGKYKKGNGLTTVHNALGNRADYYYNKYFLPTKIDHFDKDSRLLYSEHFQWHPHKSPKPNWLEKKTLTDDSGSHVLSYYYCYDDKGNLTQEELTGNLTGNGEQTYTISRQFTDSNLVSQESFPNGKRICTSYLRNTDLVQSQLICDHNTIKIRHFYIYNGNVLVEEITDDGNTPDSQNLSGVIQRKITNYLNNSQTDLPVEIEESCLDLQTNQKQLISKKIIHRDARNLILKTDHYDSHNQHAYSLHYTYDEKRRLIKETDPMGNEKCYTYDANNNISSLQKPSESYLETYTYDAMNRQIALKQEGKDAFPHSYTFSYDPLNRKIQETDYLDNPTNYKHDYQGNVTHVILPPQIDYKAKSVRRPTQTATYNTIGMPTSKTDPEENTTFTKWTLRKKPYHIIHPDKHQETFLYDLSGNLIKHTDPEGVTTHHTYDFLDRLTSTKILSHEGHLLSQESYTYSSLNLLSHTAPDGTVTTYTYDYAGRKIEEKTLGRTKTFSYDSLGRLYQTNINSQQLHTKIYDLLDRVIEEREEDTQKALYSSTRYTYDAYGNQNMITKDQSKYAFDYNCFKELTKKVDPLGHTTYIKYGEVMMPPHQIILLTRKTFHPDNTFTFETLNHRNKPLNIEKKARTYQTLLSETYHYDLNDNLISQESHIPQTNTNIKKEWSYDSRNRQILLLEEEGKITRYAYTPNGHLKTLTKPDHSDINYTYDGLGRLKTISTPDLSYALSYDALGNITEWTDGHRTINRTYSPFSELLEETFPNETTTSRTYDTLSRPTSLTLPDNSSIHYNYDPYHLTSIHRISPSGETLYTHLISEYDLRHHPITETLLTGETITHTYDFLGRQTKTNAPYSEEAITNYDSMGNPLTYLRQLPHKTEQTHYTYDLLNQLASETGNFNITYTHDSHYNRLTKNNAPYTYNKKHELQSFNDTPFQYDPNGNLTYEIIDGQPFAYTYDTLNRLTTITSPHHSYTFTYDYWNRILSYTHNKATHTLLYDDQKELGTLTTLRILNPLTSSESGATIAIEQSNQILLPYHDLTGNILAIQNTEGDTLEHHRYTPFGERLSTHTLIPWHFQSKRTFGPLTYFGNRFYHPHLGRFNTPDPLGFQEGPNLYQYSRNNPFLYIDPYGLSTMTRVGNILRDSAIGITHGLLDVVYEPIMTLSDLSHYGISYLYSDRQAYLDGYYSFRNSIDSAYNDFFQKTLASDPNASAYHFLRTPVRDGVNLGLMATGAYALGKSAVNLTSKALKTPRPIGPAFFLPKQSLTNSNGWILPKEGGGAFINNLWYTEHALERMAPRTPEVMAELETRFLTRSKTASQNLSPNQFREWCLRNAPDPRGIPPSVVEAEIAKPGSTGIRVVLSEKEQVVTVIPGGQ
ncbi:MAG: RHS repeat-associated core domain-containing protein [Chlamydiia bacterium]|nr:RHS repeat-associated core domain-containing protein [Chlamydiia bacterium]